MIQGTGMNAFLILARCGTDDIPMAIFESHKPAIDYALDITFEDIRNRALDAMEIDVSDFICVSIVEFKDGSAVSSEMVRDLQVKDQL